VLTDLILYFLLLLQLAAVAVVALIRQLEVLVVLVVALWIQTKAQGRPIKVMQVEKALKQTLTTAVVAVVLEVLGQIEAVAFLETVELE
jgi:hypothetical protein